MDYFSGLIGTFPLSGVGSCYSDFIKKWSALNSTEYPGAGESTISFYVPFTFDAMYILAQAAKNILNDNKSVNGENMFKYVTSLNYTGVSGINLTLFDFKTINNELNFVIKVQLVSIQMETELWQRTN